MSKTRIESVAIKGDLISIGFSKEEANRIEEAKAIIVETQRASTAMIMKRMKVSFREAADIMDKLEAEGMIGPPTGSGSARKILVAA